jgi:hypothetical protein
MLRLDLEVSLSTRLRYTSAPPPAGIRTGSILHRAAFHPPSTVSQQENRIASILTAITVRSQRYSFLANPDLNPGSVWMTNFLLLNDYSTLEDSSALISEFATLKQRGIFLFCNGHLQRILSGSRYRRMYDYEHRDFKRCVCELALPRQ